MTTGPRVAVPPGAPVAPLRVAIVNPLENAYSETFIRAHRERLDADVLYFSGAPTFMTLAGTGTLPVRWARSRRALRALLAWSGRDAGRVLSAEARALADEWTARGVQVVLAEFGPTGCAVLPACRAAGLPLVVHFHGFDASRTRVLVEYAERYRELFAYASAIVSVSRPMIAALVRMGAPAEKIVEAPYGPSERFFDVDPDPASRRVLAVGRMVAKKGPELTIRAFARARERHPDAELVMAGDGVLLEPCAALVREGGLDGSVRLLGAVSHDEVLALMASSALFVQHSRTAEDGDQEGTPVAILEAQASGLAVVATRHAGIPDVVVHGETGLLVEEGDVEGMGAALSELLADPARAAAYGAAGRRRVLERFTLERHISALDGCLRRAARATSDDADGSARGPARTTSSS